MAVNPEAIELMNDRFQLKKTALVLCAVVAVACEGGMNSPVSPSAVAGSASALNADGSNLKASSPLAISPLFEATNISTTPTLAARAARAATKRASLAQRFQVTQRRLRQHRRLGHGRDRCLGRRPASLSIPR